MAVRVQEADFDVGAELDRLTAGNRKIGGLAVFVGLVREMHVREGYHKDRVDALTLEHYPGMTEKALEEIEGFSGQIISGSPGPLFAIGFAKGVQTLAAIARQALSTIKETKA